MEHLPPLFQSVICDVLYVHVKFQSDIFKSVSCRCEQQLLITDKENKIEPTAGPALNGGLIGPVFVP